MIPTEFKKVLYGNVVTTILFWIVCAAIFIPVPRFVHVVIFFTSFSVAYFLNKKFNLISDINNRYINNNNPLRIRNLTRDQRAIDYLALLVAFVGFLFIIIFAGKMGAQPHFENS